MSIARRRFTRGSDGGSTLTAPPAKISAWSSSRRRAPLARSISARTLRPPLPVLVVADIEAARDQLVAAGVEVGEFFHDGREGRGSGLHPKRLSYRSRALFSDPDGNGWHLQEVMIRDPSRVEPGATSFSSASDLASALRRAEAAHGEHKKRIGQRDANWADWYAEYMWLSSPAKSCRNE
jgi:hypothetical protein